MKILNLLAGALLLPCLALASLEDPFEKRILTPVNPNAYQEGLCPGSTLKQIPAPVQDLDTFEMPVEQRVPADLRMQTAMRAAAAVYNLPDLETSKSGQDLVNHLKPFLQSLPAGYDPYAYISEPESGMKYMILAPSSAMPAKTPWILAIAGTQSWQDLAADLDMGWAQLKKAAKLFSLLTTCQYMDANQKPMASLSWIITGHSLGGGLAQAFAYKVQKERLDQHLSPVDIQLITFNAFGAQQLISKDETYQPAVASYLKAKNFFIHGDPVSRIGTHIGSTFQLTLDGEDVDDKLDIHNPKKLYHRHSMDTVMEIVAASKLSISALSLAPQRTPPVYNKLDSMKLAAIGKVFRFLPEKIYKHEEGKYARVLHEAAQDALTLDPTDPNNKKVIEYIGRLILARISGNARDSLQELKDDWQRLTLALR